MRKQIVDYVYLNFGNLVVPSEPMKFGDGMWHTQLSVNYPLKMEDEETYVVVFNGLGELVFDKSFKLVRGTTRAELITTLNKLMAKLVAMHTSHMAEKVIGAVE